MKTARRVEPTGRVQDNDMAKMKRAATPRKAAKTDVFARAAKLGISREELERVPTEKREALLREVKAQAEDRGRTVRRDSRLVRLGERQQTDRALPARGRQGDAPAQVALAARVNKSDAPRDYDEELGVIIENTPKAKPPSTKIKAQWARLATDIVGRLGGLSRYRGHMPRARLPELKKSIPLDATTVRALPQLEALHRALFPGWREILRGWFARWARYHVESKQRRLRERERDRGKRVNLIAVNRPQDGATMLAILRHNPGNLMGRIPNGLSPEILDFLAARVTRGGGRNGGYTPETALATAEDWAGKPDGFAAIETTIKDRKKKRDTRRARLQKRKG